VQLSSADPWVSYGRTVVDVLRPEEGTLTVRSAPGADTASWPWPTEQPVHILTAWDPGPERPGPVVNRARQAALEIDLRPMALTLMAAVGVDPVTGRREEGVAVIGVAESVVLAVGACYGQDAVFAWTPATWSIVGCQGGRRITSGWALRGSPDHCAKVPGRPNLQPR
jgi:Protein of unknown function (DUF3293)